MSDLVFKLRITAPLTDLDAVQQAVAAVRYVEGLTAVAPAVTVKAEVDYGYAKTVANEASSDEAPRYRVTRRKPRSYGSINLNQPRAKEMRAALMKLITSAPGRTQIEYIREVAGDNSSLINCCYGVLNLLEEAGVLRKERVEGSNARRVYPAELAA